MGVFLLVIFTHKIAQNPNNTTVLGQSYLHHSLATNTTGTPTTVMPSYDTAVPLPALGFSLATAAWLERSSKQQAVFKNSAASAATVTLAAATQEPCYQR